MFARSITTDSEEFLRNEWQSFKRDVPFMRWYSDNTLEEGTEEDEALVADLD